MLKVAGLSITQVLVTEFDPVTEHQAETAGLRKIRLWFRSKPASSWRGLYACLISKQDRKD